LREKLPRRLAGVSGRVEVNDDRLSHDEPPYSGFRFQVPGFRFFNPQPATGNMQLGGLKRSSSSSNVPIRGPRSPESVPYPLPAGS
jgi:hypothetical protein